MPMATSPGRPWRLDLPAEDGVVAQVVADRGHDRRVGGEGDARAGRAGRTGSGPPARAARCWASAAEPPLPKARTLPPARRQSAMRWPTSSTSSALLGEEALLERRCSRAATARMPAISMARPWITIAAMGRPRQNPARRWAARCRGCGRSAGPTAPPGSSTATWKTVPSRTPGGNAHGHREPALDLALAAAARAVEDVAARALAGRAARGDGHVEGQHAAARPPPSASAGSRR